MAIIFNGNEKKRKMKKSDIVICTNSEEELLDMTAMIVSFQSEYRQLKLNKIKLQLSCGIRLNSLSVMMAKAYKYAKKKQSSIEG